MRALEYPFGTNKASLYDAYGNKRGEFALKKGKNTLPLTQERFFLEDEFGNVFFIYDGVGTLLWEDSQKAFNFSGLSALALDSTIQGKEKDTKALQWIEVYEKNLQKGVEYLLPFGFKELERGLLEGAY